MSQTCPSYILSKIVTLLLAIITFIILSICMDSYKDYYKDRTSKNKNRWLKYQLTLFFCTGIIIYSFYKISSSRVEYTYTDGKKFSLGFFTLNLISMVAGATLSRGGEMLFYLMSILAMMLSIYIFYTTMKEFISYNPTDSGNLLSGFTGDIKKGYSTITGGFSRLRGAMGRKKQQNQRTHSEGMQTNKRQRKNIETGGEGMMSGSVKMSDSVGSKDSDYDIPSDLQSDSSSRSQTQSYDSSQEMSQMQGRRNLQSQLKKGLHGLKPTPKSQNPLKYTRQMQQQFQKIRGSYDDKTQFDYGDGRFGNIRK